MNPVKTAPRSNPSAPDPATQADPRVKATLLPPSLVSTICSIGIRRNAKAVPTALDVFPTTPAHAVVYHPTVTMRVSPANPQQVIWTVNALLSGETIGIRRKPVSRQVFAWDATGSLLITHANPMQMSGLPSKLTPSDGSVNWEYSIELQSPLLKAPMVLDPVIIIDPEP